MDSSSIAFFSILIQAFMEAWFNFLATPFTLPLVGKQPWFLYLQVFGAVLLDMVIFLKVIWEFLRINQTLYFDQSGKASGLSPSDVEIIVKLQKSNRAVLRWLKIGVLVIAAFIFIPMLLKL